VEFSNLSWPSERSRTPALVNHSALPAPRTLLAKVARDGDPCAIVTLLLCGGTARGPRRRSSIDKSAFESRDPKRWHSGGRTLCHQGLNVQLLQQRLARLVLASHPFGKVINQLTVLRRCGGLEARKGVIERVVEGHIPEITDQRFRQRWDIRRCSGKSFELEARPRLPAGRALGKFEFRHGLLFCSSMILSCY